jgi:hypothetical protein
MYATAERPLTFEEFLTWDDGSGRSFELRDGFPMSISDPSAKHEDVADDIYSLLLNCCIDLNLPYIPKRQKQVMITPRKRTITWALAFLNIGLLVRRESCAF